MGRVLILSNRLPITLKEIEGEVRAIPSMGGLATCLEHVRKQLSSLWLGWTGHLGKLENQKLQESLRDQNLVEVELTAEEVREFYGDFSNGMLWPLYHYLPAQLPLEMMGWESYKKVNLKFAEKALEIYEEGDIFWVHDYQLSLVPQMIRQSLPQAQIAFFLHIPFPSSEVFRILPCRDEILKGMLGADLIGFHTSAYTNNFTSSVLRLLGLDTTLDKISLVEGRIVKVGTYPLGINVERFELPGKITEGVKFLGELKKNNPELKILLSADRMDYTKGIPRRLLAFEKLLENRRDLVGQVIFIQVAVPSRQDIDAFDNNKRNVDEIVGRVNGKYGLPGHQPLHYITQAFSHDELLPLFRICDAMVVTPLRDGMNLVAKEFCASRIDLDGVLILSEFAGAAAEMGEALIVNPYDLEGTKNSYLEAIMMKKGERQKRMQRLRERLRFQDYRVWSDQILQELTNLKQTESESSDPVVPLTPQKLFEICQDKRLTLFLDYDGTLTGLTKLPG